MSEESASERTQRTVAELLAQYGATPGEEGPHRRRRRSDSTMDTAPQAIIQRVMSDSGRLLPVRDGELNRHGGNHAPAPERPPTRQPGTNSGYHHRLAPGGRPVDPAADTTRHASVPAVDESETQVLPVVPAAPERETAEQADGTRSTGFFRRSVRRSERAADRQVAPAVPPAPPVAPVPPVPAPAEPPANSAADVDDALARTQVIATTGALDPTRARQGPSYRDDGHLNVEPDFDHDFAGEDGFAPADEFDADEFDSSEFDSDEFDPGATESPEGIGLSELDDDAGQVEASPLHEWMAMIGQLAGGLVGGAALWLGFEWLWRILPAAALVAAVVVTVGLVLVVRRLRRTDDVQTTVFAVLVGLVVTVSPAALLLVGH